MRPRLTAVKPDGSEGQQGLCREAQACRDQDLPRRDEQEASGWPSMHIIYQFLRRGLSG